MNQFNILKKNIDVGYIYVCSWDDFKNNPNTYINEAIKRTKEVPPYRLTINF